MKLKHGEGIGFGKAIIFNEHFVVYGIPSIVSAIGKYTLAKITPGEKPGWVLEDNRKATPRYKEDKLDQQKESIDNIIKKMNLDLSKEGIHILLDGNLYCASGIGARHHHLCFKHIAKSSIISYFST